MLATLYFLQSIYSDLLNGKLHVDKYLGVRRAGSIYHSEIRDGAVGNGAPTNIQRDMRK